MEKELSELEKEFAKSKESFNLQYKEKVKQISSLLEELTKCSEEYGIPFFWDGAPGNNSFEPKSFKDKFGKLEKEFLRENDVYPQDHPGWEYSFTSGC